MNDRKRFLIYLLSFTISLNCVLLFEPSTSNKKIPQVYGPFSKEDYDEIDSRTKKIQRLYFNE